MSRRVASLSGLGLIGCSLWAGTPHAADFHAGPSDYRSVLSRLVAGDRLRLRAGEYRNGLVLQGMHGAPGRPIVIEGPAREPRARFMARAGANTVSLVDVRHLHIRNLELAGGNLAVDAVKAEGHAAYAHFVTLENLHIHDFAASQQNVAISTKCPAFGWVIRGNRIERVGTGLYLGNSDGSAPFVAGLIENNRISQTLGYNLQIKHQTVRPAGLPQAGVRQDTLIRRNLFDKAQGGNGGVQARPNLLIGHMPASGEGADDRTLIYRNIFWQNPTEALFQGEGNLALYNNLMINRHGSALRVQPHNDVPRAVDILHNTVLARDEGIAIRLRPGQNGYRQRVRHNLVFAGKPLQGGEQSQNRSGRPEEAARDLRHPDADDLSVDLTPLPALRGFASAQSDSLSYPDIDLDFSGVPHGNARLGAYRPDRRMAASLASEVENLATR